MSDYQGNIIIKNPATPTGPATTGRAPGMWKLSEVAYWIKQGVWPDPAIVPDQYFPYVSLLLSTTALGNANNNLFVDSSGAFNPVSRNGNTTQGSFTPYSTNWSNFFDGSGDYLTVSSNAAFGMGTGDFTIECWVNPTAFTGSGNVLVDMRSGTEPSIRPDLEYNSSGVLNYRVNGSTVISGGTLVIGTWSHVALARSGTTTKLFLNGVQVGSSYTDSNNYGSSAACRIGADDDGSPNAYVNGYMSNVRVVKGTAVYTSNFTPPTSPLTAISGTSLLTCQSNRFRDASTNNFTITVAGDTRVTDFGPFSPSTYAPIAYNQSDITNWSGYFDGTTSYLSVNAQTALSYGTGDFTMEAWVYPTAINSGFAPVIEARAGATATTYAFGLRVSGGVYKTEIYLGAQYTGTTTVNLNAWTHIAVSRSSGTLRIFVNGVLDTSWSSVTTSVDANAASQLIGVLRDGAGYYFYGYISNFRAVKGTAVYTATFTPPTSPLTAVSGTSLLTLQNAAFTDNSTNNFVITPFGNTTVTGNSPFNTVGYWSNYFDGASNQYLSVANNAALDLPSNNSFTIEGWIFPIRPNNGSQSGFRNIVSKRVANSLTSNYNIMLWYNSEKLGFFNGSTSSLSAGSITLNTWTHFAYVYNGATSLKLYLNGTLDSTFAVAPGATNSAPVTIGSLQDDTGTWDNFGGYISNIRIVKGSQVYTSNFTVPTTPLTAITNTSLLTCQNGRFVDNSSNAFTVTPNNSPQVQSFDPFYTSTIASNGGSMYFDGSGDYLTMPSSPAFEVGTGQFTLECWIYFNTVTNINEFLWADASGTTGGRLVMYYSGGSLQIVAAGGAGGTSASFTFVAGQWYHVAASRDASNNQRLFVNGALLATATSTNNYTQNGFAVARAASLNGYMAGIRLVKGTALYTAAFTPPTAPVTPTAATTLLVNGMNAGIYDATTINDMETVGNAQVTTAVSKFGGSSVYFDGSGDYLVTYRALNLRMGAGNITAECWIYPTSKTGWRGIFCKGNNSSQFEYSLGWEDSVLTARLADNGSFTVTDTVTLNAWNHIAYVRNGTNFTVYINGTAQGTATSSTSFVSTQNNEPFLVGYYNFIGDDAWFQGYIDDLRVTKGVARYTSNFTPPTQAFPVY